MRQDVTESLKSAVRYLIPMDPRCLRWKMLSLSGPKARVLLQLLIPLVTWSVVNITAELKYFRLISLHTNRVSREEVCLPSFEVMNCRLKSLAICFGEVTWEPSNVIASFSALGVDLPSIALIVLHSFVGSVL